MHMTLYLGYRTLPGTGHAVLGVMSAEAATLSQAAEFLQDEGASRVSTCILAHAFEPAAGAGAATGDPEHPDGSPCMPMPTPAQAGRALKVRRRAARHRSYALTCSVSFTP